MPEVTTDHTTTANGTAAPVDPAAAKPEPDLAARRAELKAIAEGERQKHASRVAEKQQLAAAQARIAQAEESARQANARAQAMEAELSDPLAFARKRGISARDLAERVVREGSPEDQLHQAIAAAQAAEQKTEALRQELAQREARGRAEAAQMQARKALLDAVEGSKAKMPILARLPSDRMIAEYMATYQAVQNHPDTAESLRAGAFTDAELLEATEARLLADLQERLDSDVIPLELLEKHLTKRKTPASIEVKTEPASGTQDTRAASSSRQARTLSSALQSGSSSSWKPDNWDKLSDKKQNEILVARIRSGQPID